ncbi:TPA: acetyl-CoA carboxylase biotin carboxyl carrier protein subunit [Burkholderia cepacia]|uniref:acetyl-CoA carboxylase biotin carboxyl carrier protein n=1 Tax=Burkholderia cepacia TaxID=292 RepID=UPI001CF2ACF5|nr:biotin/lipoyl-containing protein [Burkholderia cepacia]MCA8358217.1 acetyl-CoA carboxylase biotin carboxyl carrier protein [Burkholderia cepacia]HDR9759521.1 acetyl-CoA carboxylase biotin carboxyl carrier protein [Burkholderia cepacia ATCC 25416]HDV6365812.1 acetyl-CoA carboxylase biotin carboxyl carrier protein [Burkholderia cepacia]
MIALEEIKHLIDLVTQHRVSALDVTKGDLRIRIETAPTAVRTAGAAAVEPAAHADFERSDSATPAPATDAAAGSGVASEQLVVRAPADGIVHLAPTPGAPPFVRVGQTVQADDIVCVIEVMKMFHPVPATVGGTIRTIRVEDGQSIGYDEVLFVLS